MAHLAFTGSPPAHRCHMLLGPALAFTAVSLFAAGPLESRFLDVNRVELRYVASADTTYQLQFNRGISSRYWSDLAPATVGALGDQTFICLTQGKASEFFRLLRFTGSAFWYDWNYYVADPTLVTWGLGTSQEDYVHNDRAYEWYVDQADTGAHSDNNCGPSSVTMAIRWYRESYAGTAEQARQTYRPEGGWWYTSDILNYLDLQAVPRQTSAFTGAEQLAGLVGNGSVCILCLSTAYLDRTWQSEGRAGRFYDYASGHFLVVKGARRVSGSLFLETYDPNNWHAQYGDLTPKGRNRHYLGEQIASAVSNWWNYVIVVPAPGGGGSALANRWLRPVQPSEIPDMPGR